MTKKWSVKKQDGVWKVFDKSKRLRFSCDNHFMALSFALMQGDKKPTFTARYGILDAEQFPGAKWQEVMRYFHDQGGPFFHHGTPTRPDDEDDDE